jgi:hypothetical protein
MKKYIQYRVLYRVLYAVVLLGSLSACQSQFVTTPNLPTEANLVANSVNNGLETELDIDYRVAFKNLKMAYGQCVAFTGEHDFVFTDNKLEQDLEMGTLFARTEGGAYLSKTLVESIGNNKTRLTLFLPAGYKSAQARFKLDAKRALGQDPSCNVAKPI